MTNTPQIIIPNDTVLTKFHEHLTIENNKRILFSAPFGAGKSYFLKQYFAQSDKFISINLYPVDYSVSSNEDIFEIIKYDVLSVLLKKYEEEIELDEEDFSSSLLIQNFVQNNIDYLSLIMSASTFLTGSEAGEKLVAQVKKIFDSYAKYKSEMDNDELDVAVRFIGDLRYKKGTFREADNITTLIKDFISRIKQKLGDKKFVLTIDDLDRLDPEHIFRIINVFTAHSNGQEESNKFGFDSIVLVCDLNSLRHMFLHRYGQLADFEGYIDKFYAFKPFIFDNKRYLKDSIDELIQQKSTDLGSEGANENYGSSSPFYYCIRMILGDMVDSDIIKLRSFTHFQLYSIPNTNFRVNASKDYSANAYHFLVLIHNLRQFFSGIYELKKVLLNMSNEFASDYHPNSTISLSAHEIMCMTMAVPFVISYNIAFSSKAQSAEHRSYDFVNEKSERIIIRYRINKSEDRFNGGVIYLHVSSEQTINEVSARPNIYWFLFKALENCERLKIVR